jgi:hypothetical protein
MFGRKIFEKYANFALLFVGNEKNKIAVRFQVLMTASMKITAF